MEKKTLDKELINIYNLIENKSLRKALKSLNEIAKDAKDWESIDAINQVDATYLTMLDYMSQGVNDPQRDALYNSLLYKIYHIADLIFDKRYDKCVSSIYYSKKRTLNNGSVLSSFEQLKKNLVNINLTMQTEYLNSDINRLRLAAEDGADSLFNIVWSKFPYKSLDVEEIKEVLNSDVMTEELCSLVVSAVTLGSLQWYDDKKLMLLLELCHNENSAIRQRAIVGLGLLSLKYESRILLNNDISSMITELCDWADFSKNLRTIQAQLIRTRETEKISKTLNEEIFPVMMKKIAPLTSDKLKLEETDLDINPEWEQAMIDSGLDIKLKEITELQLEGSDVLMSAFSNLKWFGFFNIVSNWFLPFYSEHSVLNKLSDNQNLKDKTIDIISSARFLCNSDKYSFCLSIAQMPLDQIDMLSLQLDEKNSEMQELKNSDILASVSNNDDTISNLYIQDLYRFFKLFNLKNEFEDPFNSDLIILNSKLFTKVFNSEETRSFFAELLFKKGFYSNAIDIFEQISIKEPSNAKILQKIGFCYQMNCDYSKAIEAYKHSEMLEYSKWTLKKLALCCKNTKQFAEAVSYYKQIEQSEHENISLLMNIGNCLFALGNYEEALKYYFKIDYFDSDNRKVISAIAWTSFLLQRYEQAERYFAKILSDSPSSVDCMNAGHNQWAIGNISAATELYKRSFKIEKDWDKQFYSHFKQDIPDLIKAGISSREINMMLDFIAYDREQN